MSKNKSIFPDKKFTGVAILLVAVITTLLFQIEDSYQLCLLLLLGSVLIIHPLPLRQWTVIDLYICLITVYDIITCLYAHCLVPAIHGTLLSMLCCTTYFVSRKLFTSKHATRIVLQSSYLPIGISLILSLCSFFLFRQSIL